MAGKKKAAAVKATAKKAPLKGPPFEIGFTPISDEQLTALEKSPALARKYSAVRKALKFLSADPRHPALKCHKFSSLSGPNGCEVFEAYAENNTPGAWRIFWYYGPAGNEITVLLITPHPNK